MPEPTPIGRVTGADVAALHCELTTIAVGQDGDCRAIAEAVATLAMINAATRRSKVSSAMGPEHDDQHSRLEWCSLIEVHLARAKQPERTKHREQLVKIAALAIAAAQSYDRLDERATP